MKPRWRRWVAGGALLLAASPLLAPEVLAFPYHRQVGGKSIYSVAPMDGLAIDAVIARADRLVAASPLARTREPRRIFLTDGGWRWRWLAPGSAGAFALSRPAGEPIVLNRSDVAGDRVMSGAPVGGTRTLSGTIAHEMTHGMIRRRFGLRSVFFPQWLVEGYADFVAQESSLSAEEVAALEAKGVRHPAIPYFRGRQRVAQELARNGGSVERLFEDRR